MEEALSAVAKTEHKEWRAPEAKRSPIPLPGLVGENKAEDKGIALDTFVGDCGMWESNDDSFFPAKRSCGFLKTLERNWKERRF